MVSSEHNVNVYGYFPSYPTDRSEIIEKKQKKKNIGQHLSLKTKFLTGLKRSVYLSTEILFYFSAKWKWILNEIFRNGMVVSV